MIVCLSQNADGIMSAVGGLDQETEDEHPFQSRDGSRYDLEFMTDCPFATPKLGPCWIIRVFLDTDCWIESRNFDVPRFLIDCCDGQHGLLSSHLKFKQLRVTCSKIGWIPRL